MTDAMTPGWALFWSIWAACSAVAALALTLQRPSSWGWAGKALLIAAGPVTIAGALAVALLDSGDR